MDPTEPIDPTEPTTPFTPPDYPLPDLVLSAEAKYFLHTAGRWATFLGVLGFIITGIIVIFAIIAGSIFSLMGAYSANNEPAGVAMMMSSFASFAWIFYLAIAAFYFFFSYYIYTFGSKIKSGINFNDNVIVTKALGSLKSFFKLWGVSTIVIISLYILGIIVVMVFALAMHSAFTPH